MEKAFLTAAALRNANGGRLELTVTIKLWTSLVPGDVPFLVQGLCHGPALVENSPNFKLSFFSSPTFYFLSLIMPILPNMETFYLKKKNPNQKTPLCLVILFNLSLDCFHRQGF